jgi:glycosyltransferase involved in cell wall biosynthesis
VLHIISDTNIGGAGRMVLNFLEHYDRTRLRVHVLCPAGSLLAERCAAYPDVTVIAMPELPADESLAPGGLWRQIPAIIGVIRRCRIDLVHTHASFAGRLAARLAGVSVVYTRHRLEAPDTGRRLPTRLPARLLSLINNATCDRVVAVSRTVRDELLARGVDARKIAVIVNGVDLRKFQPRAPVGAPAGREDDRRPGPPIVGLVGRLEAEKGHRCFLEAARLLPPPYDGCRFWIVGEGSLAGELRAYARELGIAGRVAFLGLRDDIPDLLDRMDVVVAPSFSEACPLSLVEAMSMGKPCVASNLDSIREIVTDGRDGLLVAPGDPGGLAAKIAYLLEHPEDARRLGEAAARTAAARFDARVMAEELTLLYNECIQEKLIKMRK